MKQHSCFLFYLILGLVLVNIPDLNIFRRKIVE